jgi:hypothetical protein
MNIANMQLKKRHSHPKQRISDRNTCVRKAAWIDDNAVGAVGACDLDAVDYGTFPVTILKTHSISCGKW